MVILAHRISTTNPLSIPKRLEIVLPLLCIDRRSQMEMYIAAAAKMTVDSVVSAAVPQWRQGPTSSVGIVKQWSQMRSMAI